MAFTTDNIFSVSITGSLDGNAKTATFATDASTAAQATNAATASLALVATTAELAFTASQANTASYAAVAGTLAGGSVTKIISKISNNVRGGFFYIVEGSGKKKLFAIKGLDNGTSVVFTAGALDGSLTGTTFRAGINNTYEITFPGESGNLVDAGGYGESAYALFDNGNLYTWGDNTTGQLGLGDTTDREYPTLATSSVAEVYTHPSNGCGYYTTKGGKLLIKTNDGRIWATGVNSTYEIGQTPNTSTAVNILSFEELTWAGTNPLSVWNIGTYLGCNIIQKSNGEIWVSGTNPTSGRLGLGSTSLVTAGVKADLWLQEEGVGIDYNYRIIDVYGGERYYVGSWTTANNLAMLLDNGTNTMVKTAGWNDYGTLGRSTAGFSALDVNFTFPNRISKLVGRGAAAGTIHVLDESGNLYGWGYNGNGQIGGNGTTDQFTPVTVKDSSAADFTGVTEMYDDGPGFGRYPYQNTGPIVKRADGYYSWGLNSSYQTGTISTSTGNVENPIIMRLPAGFTATHATQTTTTQATSNYNKIRMLVGDDGSIFAWGYNTSNVIHTENTNDVTNPVFYKPNSLI